MAYTTDSQRATTRRGTALLRTDAQLMSGNWTAGRGSAALLASVLRGGSAGIGCMEILCRAFAAEANR
jgi:hypothetical protein